MLQNIDLAAASQYLDLVNLVAFDFVGPWSSVAGHHAQLYATQHHHSRHGGGGGDEPESGSAGVARLMQRGVPAKKILLGIPLYGRSFLHCSGPGHGFRDVGGEDGAFDYADLPRRGTSEQVDKRAVGALCVGGDGGFVSYDNPESVKAKAAFVKQKGLAVGVLSPTS